MANLSFVGDRMFQLESSLDSSCGPFGSETETDTDDGWSFSLECIAGTEASQSGSRADGPGLITRLLRVQDGVEVARRGDGLKESSVMSSLSSELTSFTSDKPFVSLLACHHLEEETSDFYESGNSFDQMSPTVGFVDSSSPVCEHVVSPKGHGIRHESSVPNCRYSNRRDLCRKACHFIHEPVVESPFKIDSQSFGIPNKARIDFTNTSRQQRKYLLNWPMSPFLKFHATYQHMIRTTLVSTSSGRLEGPSTSNGLLDADAIYPCTMLNSCIIDSLIMSEDSNTSFDGLKKTPMHYW